MYNFSDFKQKLTQIIDHATRDVSTLRTGKASYDMLDTVKVEAYGGKMSVNEVANISIPDANMILIKPWDQNLLENIEKGIHKADINLNPVVDGDQIRIVVPPLTQETRQAMVKQLHQKIESAKVMVRNARTDQKNEIEDSEDEAGVSEDDIKRYLEEMDKIVKEYNSKLDEMAEAKEAELMKI